MSITSKDGTQVPDFLLSQAPSVRSRADLERARLFEDEGKCLCAVDVETRRIWDEEGRDVAPGELTHTAESRAVHDAHWNRANALWHTVRWAPEDDENRAIRRKYRELAQCPNSPERDRQLEQRVVRPALALMLARRPSVPLPRPQIRPRTPHAGRQARKTTGPPDDDNGGDSDADPVAAKVREVVAQLIETRPLTDDQRDRVAHIFRAVGSS